MDNLQQKITSFFNYSSQQNNSQQFSLLQKCFLGASLGALGLYGCKRIKDKIQIPEFKNKILWITGASSGIGEELAVKISNLGAKKIILSSRNLQELERVKNRCNLENCEIEIFQMDMQFPYKVKEQVEQFVKNNLEKKNQKLDVLILNAGLTQRVCFEELSFENHEYITNVNYLSPTAHVKALLSHLKNNKGSQIVYINSISGKRAMANRGSYCGSKYASVGFFDVLRAELYPNVDITQIYPGYTQTNVSKNALMGPPMEKMNKTDKNILKGMKLDVFIEKAIKSIYLRKKDDIIDNVWSHHWEVAFKELVPNYIHSLTVKDIKHQQISMNQAK